MAQVSYLPDAQQPPIDGKLEEIAAESALASRTIRIRLQPDLYSPDRAKYESWKGLVWAVELEDVEEGRKLREGLQKFFAAFGDGGKQAALLEALEGL